MSMKVETSTEIHIDDRLQCYRFKANLLQVAKGYSGDW